MAVEVVWATDVSPELPRELSLRPGDIEDLVAELAAYYGRFAPLFKRREQRAWAEVYLKGLLVADVPRKNVEAITLRLFGAGPDIDKQVRGLQQFVGEGGWNDQAILAEHRRSVEESLGEEDGVLILDGSDVAKQGTHSAGVARQWCGASGKTDNCQAGVYLGYASRQGYTLLDRHLFLPERWFTEEYRERWEKCQIPEGTAFRTKTELAATMVEGVMREGVLRARWVVCDEDFGKAPELLDRIEATGLLYLAEVAKKTEVWPLMEPDGKTPRALPKTWVPPQKPSGMGRIPTKEQLHPDSPPKMRVDVLGEQLSTAQWHRYRILEGAKGPLVADFAAVRAVVPRDALPGPEVWAVIRRKVSGPEEEPEWKFYLSCAPVDTLLAVFVRVSGMRWPIESCFAESKGELGLDQYELRFFRGWHHHMTMVILAHHFLVLMQQRLSQKGGPEARGGARAEGAAQAAAGGDDGMPGPAPRVGEADAGDGGEAQPGRGADAAAGCPAPTGLRSVDRPGATGVPASPQSRSLSLPSQAQAAAAS